VGGCGCVCVCVCACVYVCVCVCMCVCVCARSKSCVLVAVYISKCCRASAVQNLQIAPGHQNKCRCPKSRQRTKNVVVLPSWLKVLFVADVIWV